MTNYQEVIVNCKSAYVEILIAEFALLGFDTFQELDEGFITFYEGVWDDNVLDGLIAQYAEMAGFSYSIRTVEKRNWNKEWEKNYEPIVVEETCIVKAPFHNDLKQYPIQLIIEPKMSFGTGHHETTYLMLAEMLSLDFNNKAVMDAGTGTGVLAILAKKQGAKEVLAFDIDDWCVENANENAETNEVQIKVMKTSIEELKFVSGYNIVLANINKNVLLAQMKYYKEALLLEGQLLVSGFYSEDLNDVNKTAEKEGLVLEASSIRNNWSMARFTKKAE